MLGRGDGTGDGAAVGIDVGVMLGWHLTSSCIRHSPLPVNSRTHPPPAAPAAETIKAPRSRSWLSMMMYLVAVMSASARTATSE